MEFPAKTPSLADWLEGCLSVANPIGQLRIWSPNIPPGYRGPYRVKSLNSIVFVERGCMVALCDDTKHVLNAGDLLWIPPGVKRCFMSQSDATERALCSRYRFSVQAETHELSPLNVAKVWRGRMDLERPLAELGVLFEEKSEIQEHLVRAALVRLSAALLRECPTGSRAGLTQLQQERVLKLIDLSLSGGLSVPDLADAARLSQDWFGRMFKLTFDESPREYLVNRRMMLAAELLIDSLLSIKEICAEIGMSDQNLFSRLFKKRFGVTPSGYRSLNG